MPLRTGNRHVAAATRVGVHEGSQYMRVNVIPSVASLLMFGDL